MQMAQVAQTIANGGYAPFSNKQIGRQLVWA